MTTERSDRGERPSKDAAENLNTRDRTGRTDACPGVSPRRAVRMGHS